MSCPFLLIGHRTSGKTVLGRLLAEGLGLPFLDLDDIISAREGRSAADLVRDDVSRFRRLEQSVLREITADGNPAVIATGGGCVAWPNGIRTIWIYREGWEESALRDRRRLRPALPDDAEIAWMRETRDERYRRAAHFCLHIERGCGEKEAARRLVHLAGWLIDVTESEVLRKSWFVPRDSDDFARAEADARLFGAAGVEIRSDVFPDPPASAVPLLASLRSEDATFLQRADGAAVFDCDASLLRFLDLRGISPRPLVLSTHPDDVFKEYFDFLTGLPDWVRQALPEWHAHVLLKWAPRVKSWVELRYANQLYKVYENAGKRITFLPQGKNWKWMRVQRLFRGNDLNYLSTGCLEHSLRPPSLDYFLPHAVGNHARDFYGVIGDPVEHSFGDVFHRALSLAATDARQHNPSSAKDSAVGNDQRSTSSSFDSGTGHDGIDETGTETYVKIPLKRAEIDNCLHLLPQIGFRGLSVTSPLKSAVFESNFVGTDQDITAGNTLALIRGSFLLFDTDQLGMEAALAEIEADGIAPGTVAIFGSGGARDALTRALEQRGWGPIEIVRARDGWGELTSRGFTLVVDASGSSGSEHTLRHTNAPTCRVWFDLRYRDIPPPPLRAERFYSGMTFYKHQALAQRRLWGLPETNGHPLL